MAKRPNIMKLATKISLESMTYTGITYEDSEYKCLDVLLDDDMCEIMMHMKLNTIRTTEEIAQRSKRSTEFTQEQIDKLVKTGVVRKKTENGKTGYTYPIWVPGIMEGFMSNKEQCDKYPILGECFEEYTRKRLGVLVPFLSHGMAFMRVMPVMSAIESNSRTASTDELRTIIENTDAISVGPCSCRRSRRLMGEGCGHIEDDMCIYIGENAKNFAELGDHRMITKEEAYEILKRAEDNGLVHEINQTDGIDSVGAICNCCGCSCYALRIANYFRTPEGISSNYRAKVDKEKCVACGQCVENCQTNAIRLGKKLCSINPDPEVKPDITPDDEFWGPQYYNTEYRTNRSDVMDVGSAPCKAACPAHIPVQGYIKLASEGRYLDALELIKKENPFPAVCGRICNKKCEEECTRRSVDEAIAIDDIKKFIADKELTSETRFVPPMLNQTGKPYPQKIAVIGAGPAGLSCAYCLAIKGYPVTVFEKEKVLGGMLTLGIPSFRLEKNVINAEINILKEMGIEFRTGVTVGRDITLEELRTQGFKAFYLGIGASKGTPVGCKGDDLPGVLTGIDFLRDVNIGKKPKIGTAVAVIGGGNVAMDVARTALRLGADTTVLYRRSREEMPASNDEIEEAIAEGVKFRYLASPSEILGTDHVEGIKVEIMELGEADEKGRRKPVGTGKFETLPVTSVISAIGQKVDLTGLDSLKTTEKGTVYADGFTYQTSVDDVFAGGDVMTGPKFAIDAIAAGKEGAISIHRYVHPGQSLTLGRDRRDYKSFDKNNVAISIDSFDNCKRQVASNVSPKKAVKNFKDPRGTFTEEQMKKEADRCLGCGVAVVNENMCVGCGICTTKCKFDAIHLEKYADDVGTPYFKTLIGVASGGGKRMAKIAAKKVFAPAERKQNEDHA